MCTNQARPRAPWTRRGTHWRRGRSAPRRCCANIQTPPTLPPRTPLIRADARGEDAPASTGSARSNARPRSSPHPRSAADIRPVRMAARHPQDPDRRDGAARAARRHRGVGGLQPLGYSSSGGPPPPPAQASAPVPQRGWLVRAHDTRALQLLRVALECPATADGVNPSALPPTARCAAAGESARSSARPSALRRRCREPSGGRRRVWPCRRAP